MNDKKAEAPKRRREPQPEERPREDRQWPHHDLGCHGARHPDDPDNPLPRERDKNCSRDGLPPITDREFG